jgi:hypothetical protein
MLISNFEELLRNNGGSLSMMMTSISAPDTMHAGHWDLFGVRKHSGLRGLLSRENFNVILWSETSGKQQDTDTVRWAVGISNSVV